MVDETLIGIPHKLGAKSLKESDCVGVVTMWLRSEGFDVKYEDGKGPITTDWCERSPRRFLEDLLKVGNVVRFSELQKYDCLLLFGNEQCLFPSALAVMVDDRHILTSTDARGSFVEMLSQYWKDRFWGAVRLHGS